ncbi:CcdC family protein [Paenibacillus solisilvae]|uniref:CcdC family protein n=1 Tax=Paenibacillus solisilvae TaxID=2486751 RepID=A0ABW0W7H3_9BACL
MQIQTIPIVLAAAALIIWRRTRAVSRPIQGKGLKMLLPLLFLIPAVLMFANPELHLTIREIVLAVGTGIVLSIPLILTTNYELRADGQIYAKKSTGFIISFVGLLIFRLVLRDYLSNLDPNELTALFFLVAAAYILPWRIASYLKFRRLLESRTAKSDSKG